MFQICVSGAARGTSVAEGKALAQAAGRAIAKAGHALITGATIGLPNYAAEAYKAADGIMSIGLSPAATKVEHVLKYHLPTRAYDAIVYTGLRYIGRDALLVNSADAVISVGGRIGTLHEFTVALETETPIGLLQGGGGISEEFEHILKAAHEERNPNIIFSNDANDLIIKLETLLKKRLENNLDLYK